MINRVQKLLFSEYCDFEDMVLIESPFAQTTRDGTGIRQVHLGLTPSKLVLATDMIPPVEKSLVGFLPGLDPEIETFELIAIYPVECVNLSVFRQRRRQALKAHFCNNKVFFFELGGFEKRKMFWNLWQERVKFLTPEPSSSHSETSVATSSSNSTLYLLNSKQVIRPNGIRQLWCSFACGNNQSETKHKWTDRYLYMGKDLEEGMNGYKPMNSFPSERDFVAPNANSPRYQPRMSIEEAIKSQHSASLLPPSTALLDGPPSLLMASHSPFSKRNVRIKNSNQSIRRKARGKENELRKVDSIQVNRFGSGIDEKCSTGLFLPIKPKRYYSKATLSDVGSPTNISEESVDFCALTEQAVRLWEIYKESNLSFHCAMRHRRRYGLAPQPLFFHGLGPWSVSPGSRYSVQIKRAVSLVCIKRQPIENELRLPISKRQLLATISCETLTDDFKNRVPNMTNGAKKPVVFFWTPDYWYRPRSPKDAYRESIDHLSRLRDYQNKQKEPKARRSIFRRKYKREKEIILESESYDSDDLKYSTKKKKTIFFNVLTNRNGTHAGCCLFSHTEQCKKPYESSLQHLRRILRMDVVLTAWDFDSTTLAQQLTTIDKALFLKVVSVELNVLLWQQSSKNAPNLAALIAFSHRISCLVATEVLRDDSEKIRARLIARFINVADKCHKMANFQSCRTILAGLQSPAVYRLKATWAYVRKKHASKYRIFEELSRIYRDPRLPTYQKAFLMASQSGACMPFIGDILIKLLDRVPEYKVSLFKKTSVTTIKSKSSISKTASSTATPCFMQNEDPEPNLVTKLLRNLKIIKVVSEKEIDTSKTDTTKSIQRTEFTKIRSLSDYYKPLNIYEDNRIKCLEETREFLEKCQLYATAYAFNKNDLCKDYLLKARYREDKENFITSLSVEPPLVNKLCDSYKYNNMQH